MKKIIYCSLLVLALGAFAACSSTEKPGEAAKKYTQYLADGKYEEFVNAIEIDSNETAEEAGKEKEMLVALLQEKARKSIDEKGGIKNIEILSEVISADGNEAKVMLKQTYGNGETEDTHYDLVRKEGVWKIVLKK